MSPKLSRRSRTAALFAAVLALVLALPGFASADPLGETTICPTSGLRSTALITMPTLGPDGNVWFSDNKIFSSNTPAIGKVSPSCSITEYIAGTNLSGLTTGATGNDPVAIVAGPEGSKYLWFTDKGTTTPSIGVIDSASPETATTFSISLNGGNAGSVPQGIVVGPEGNLWFADAGATPAIGKIELSSPTGNAIKSITECGIQANGGNEGSKPRGITVGPDGNLWFTDTGTTKAIGKVNPSTCAVQEFSTGAFSEPGGSGNALGAWGIVTGPDGNIWFTENGTEESKGPKGKAICRITPSGTISCFSEGLAETNAPHGIVSAEGKLWFSNESVVQEQQELEIKATENLGGTYKLGYEGKETGATGSGNLLSSAKGTGDVTRCATCKGDRTLNSNILKNVKVESGTLEVGMRISGTGFTAAENTITAIEGTGPYTVTMSKNAVSTGAAGSFTAGRVINVNTTEGKFETGQTLSGTGLATSTIIATGEKEGKGTLTPATVPTAAGTGVALTASTSTVVTGVTTSTGAFSTGEVISGKGIPAGAKINSISTTLKTLTLSATPTEAGTAVALSADLSFSAEASVIQGALEKLSTFGTENGEVSGSGSESPIKRTIIFKNERQATDPAQITCNGAGLTGTSPSCSVATTVAWQPNTIGSVTTKKGKITTYPVNGAPGLSGATLGSDGNLWFVGGSRFATRFGSFGIECVENCPPTNRRTITLTKAPAGNAGEGLGTVSSKPKGIKCAQYCNEAVGRLFKNQAVVLTAAPSGEGSAFDKWVGCPSAVGLVCTIPADGNDYEVEAVFKGSSKAFSPAEALSFSKGESEENRGWGTVKASGLTCEADCDGTTVLYQGPTTKPGKTVILKEIPAFGSEFTGWSGCTPISETECKVEMSEAKSVTAEFADLPDYALTLEKPYAGGLGTVSSKPKGISCATTCTKAAANMPEGASVTLTAKPASTEPLTTFKEWVGGDCNGSTSPTCTVGMDKAETLKAVFSGPVKAIVEPKSLTLSKEGSGYGTVKAAGLTCEVLCTSATSLYYGPVTSPKAKAGAKVTLKAISAPGSKAVEWTGCETNPTPSECVVVMETDKSVSAKFDELE
jgi:streptogramin lyase